MNYTPAELVDFLMQIINRNQGNYKLLLRLLTKVAICEQEFYRHKGGAA